VTPQSGVTAFRPRAKAHGWNNELWTAARVARLIEREFDIRYHPEHVREVLKRRLGWTSQKPRRKARERDDKEVARWVGDEFPRIVRQAWERKAYVVFLDESGFFLTPTVRRTLAPRGKTPVLEAWDRRDRISAISCVTLSPVAGRPGLVLRIGRRLFPSTQTALATWRSARSVPYRSLLRIAARSDVHSQTCPTSNPGRGRRYLLR
jgi:hypothetical protein